MKYIKIEERNGDVEINYMLNEKSMQQVTLLHNEIRAVGIKFSFLFMAIMYLLKSGSDYNTNYTLIRFISKSNKEVDSRGDTFIF